METIKVLTERISISGLEEPAPDKIQMELVFQAALRAPDHGRLTPWLFITVEKEERNKLGEMMYASLSESENTLSADELQKWQIKPLKAPMIIIASAKIKEHPKITIKDMVLSTAAAVQNMKLALFDMGFCSYWRTGIITTNSKFKNMLGLETRDEIIGFLYVGTAQESQKTIPVRNSSEYFIPLSRIQDSF